MALCYDIVLCILLPVFIFELKEHSQIKYMYLTKIK